MRVIFEPGDSAGLKGVVLSLVKCGLDIVIQDATTEGTSRHKSDEETTCADAATVVQALARCKALIWGNAACAVAFCVYRDVCRGQAGAYRFERMLKGKGISVSVGTVNAAIYRNRYMRMHVDKWDAAGAMKRVLRLRDAICREVSSQKANEKILKSE